MKKQSAQPAKKETSEKPETKKSESAKPAVALKVRSGFRAGNVVWSE